MFCFHRKAHGSYFFDKVFNFKVFKLFKLNSVIKLQLNSYVLPSPAIMFQKFFKRLDPFMFKLDDKKILKFSRLISDKFNSFNNVVL